MSLPELELPIATFPTLPIELVEQILCDCASTALHERRMWALNIALVNRDTYLAIKGILYETMVITPDNYDQVFAMFYDDSFLHVFRAVVRLIVTQNFFEIYNSGPTYSWEGATPRWWEQKRFFSAFSCLEDFDIPLRSFQYMTRYASFAPRRLAINFGTIISIYLTDSKAGVLASLTHISGYFHARSVGTILENAPALTHFAFDFTRTEREDNYSNNPTILHPPIKLDELELVLQTAVLSKLLTVIAVAINGDHVVRYRKPVKHIVRKLGDPRVRLWFDERRIGTRDDEEQFREEDAWAGRDVWTEAKPFVDIEPDVGDLP